MNRLLWQKRVRPWLARRWYQPLMGLVAVGAIAIPASGLMLAVLPHTDHPLRLCPLAGLLGGISFSIVQLAIAMAVTMRCPQTIRIALVLSITALSTVFTWYIPTAYLQQLPLIIAVDSACFGSLLVGVAYRSLFRRSLVGPGGYSLGSSSQKSDMLLLVVMMLFFWVQYDGHVSRRLSMSFDSGFLWSCVAAGAATSWCFLARSHFKNRLVPYVIATPIVIVAVWKGSVCVHDYMYFPLPWFTISIVAVAALIGWILAQELGYRFLVASHWKWRAPQSVDVLAIMEMLPELSHPPRRRIEIARVQQSWWCLAGIFLILILGEILFAFEGSLFAYSIRRYLEFALMTIMLALAVSCFVLAAHQIQRLWILCLILAAYLLVLASVPPEMLEDSPSYVLNGILAIPIPIAAVMYMVIRLVDQQSRYTIGVVKRVREPISIQELMGGTLILGIEFAMLRTAQTEMVTLVIVLCTTLFFCLISLIVYRAYFVGMTRGIWIALGMLVVIFLIATIFDRGMLAADTLIGLGLFLGAHLMVARWLHRCGWTRIPV